jgi:dTDP-glucose pyrophosphorylase
MKAVILAAGKGTRLKPLTNSIPKCLIELNKKTLIERILIELNKTGIKKAIIVIGFKKEKIKEKLGNAFNEIELEYVIQKKQLGTGNALSSAEKKIKNNFLCLNGDSIFKAGLIRRILRQEKNDALLVAREEKHPELYGVIKTEKNSVKELIEKPIKAESNLVNSGIYKFSPKIFEAIKKTKKSKRGEIELTEAINKLITMKGKVEFIKTSSGITDIGSIQDLKKAENQLFF